MSGLLRQRRLASRRVTLFQHLTPCAPHTVSIELKLASRTSAQKRDWDLASAAEVLFSRNATSGPHKKLGCAQLLLSLRGSTR